MVVGPEGLQSEEVGSDPSPSSSTLGDPRLSLHMAGPGELFLAAAGGRWVHFPVGFVISYQLKWEPESKPLDPLAEQEVPALG